MSHAVKNPNVTKAVSRMVKAYRQRSGDDREEIALDLGMQLSTFQNKLKVAHINDFTLGELLALTELTGSTDGIRAMADEAGMVSFDPIEAMPDGGDALGALVIGTLEIDCKTGGLSQLVREAIEDNEISDDEAVELTRALRELRGMERKIEVMLEKYRKGE